MFYHTITRLFIDSYGPNIQREFELAISPEMLRAGDFYMYHELRTHREFRNIRARMGEMVYPRSYNPEEINWYVENGELIHNYEADNMAISNLRFILDNFFNPLNYEVNGKVYHINTIKDKVYAFRVRNGVIRYHINDTLDANSLYKKCCLLQDYDIINDEHFHRLVSHHYPGVSYEEYTSIDYFETMVNDYI